MMFERFTPESRAIVTGAAQRAKSLGHNHLGGEHLLMEIAASETPAGSALRDSGVTAARIAETIHAHAPFADLDREALAAVGIDLDRVRAAVEEMFGTEALRPAVRPTGRFRITPRAKDCLTAALREARRASAGYLGPEHLAFAVTGLKHGTVPTILAEIGATADQLRTEIASRYRLAG
jgi:ATP-dependent Clp protease ATP-binding subunit ClpA